MRTTRLPTASCPRCGYEMDSASGVNHNRKPKPGDFSLCLRCGQVLRFDDELVPVLALERELEELEPEQRALIRRAQRLIPTVWRDAERS